MCGWNGAHPGFQDRILLNNTRTENAHKIRKKTFVVCHVCKSSKLLVFLFPCRDIVKCLNASMLTTAVFVFIQQFYHTTEIGNEANTISACANQP